jgi:hypothetical protein
MPSGWQRVERIVSKVTESEVGGIDGTTELAYNRPTFSLGG